MITNCGSILVLVIVASCIHFNCAIFCRETGVKGRDAIFFDDEPSNIKGQVLLLLLQQQLVSEGMLLTTY